jgi:hypothetical protein
VLVLLVADVGCKKEKNERFTVIGAFAPLFLAAAIYATALDGVVAPDDDDDVDVVMMVGVDGELLLDFLR